MSYFNIAGNQSIHNSGSFILGGNRSSSTSDERFRNLLSSTSDERFENVTSDGRFRNLLSSTSHERFENVTSDERFGKLEVENLTLRTQVYDLRNQVNKIINSVLPRTVDQLLDSRLDDFCNEKGGQAVLLMERQVMKGNLDSTAISHLLLHRTSLILTTDAIELKFRALFGLRYVIRTKNLYNLPGKRSKTKLMTQTTSINTILKTQNSLKNICICKF